MTAVADELLASLEPLLSRAHARRRRTLLSVTVPSEIEDPSACAFASRLASDRWFAWEQPDRKGFALATIGSAAEVVSRGEARFGELAAGAARLAGARLAAEPSRLPAGAGPVWVGGFAFAPAGGSAPHWSSFAPASMALPEIAIVRLGDESWLTACAVVDGSEPPARTLARVERRLATLRVEPLPLGDPHPTAPSRVGSVRAPREYEDAVARAIARIGAGELAKVVLAREVTVDAPSAHDPAATFAALREVFPSCFCFCAGSPEGAFLGASPELLARRNGSGVASVALAGSTRRSADPAVDSHLAEALLRSAKDRAEHRIVVRRIERALAAISVWVEAAEDPEVVTVANIQHLATPVRAQLAEPLSAIELAGRLHPTPAVGGEPRDAALAAIEELEGLDRGWYAGPVGWMDAAEDGEFCVALRSALLRDRTAHLYAGAGIVADSDPAAELAETELKLEALLPLLVA